MPYVYVMQASDVCKIGITSTSIEQRKREIQTGCPFPITKVWSSNDIGNALEIESILHNYFNGKRTSGEWFKEKFATIVTKADMLINNPHKLLSENRMRLKQNKELINKNKKLSAENEKLRKVKANIINCKQPDKLYVSLWKASKFSGISEYNIRQLVSNGLIQTLIEDGETLIDYKQLVTLFDKILVKEMEDSK